MEGIIIVGIRYKTTNQGGWQTGRGSHIEPQTLHLAETRSLVHFGTPWGNYSPNFSGTQAPLCKRP